MNNSNQNQNNDSDQMNPLVAVILALIFWFIFTILGFMINPILYLPGLCSIAIAGCEFREWKGDKN